MNEPSPASFDAAISTRLLTRILIVVTAVWSLVEGLILTAFHGSGSGALGAGVTDRAGQRLVGAHLLVLVPVYLVIALRFDRYQGLAWVPFAGQAVFAAVVGYSIVTGDTRFSDGILAAAMGGMLAGLLGFVWVTEARTKATRKLEDEEASEAAANAPSPEDV